jgi:hypothetical protein
MIYTCQIACQIKNTENQLIIIPDIVSEEENTLAIIQFYAN